MEGRLTQRLLGYKLPRDVNCIASPKAFPPRPQRPPFYSSNRKYIGGLVYKSSGLRLLWFRGKLVGFLHGTLRMRPAAQVRAPAWDLAVTLEGLSLAPFEPLDSALDKCIALKMAFLLVITSLKRVRDLQAC